MLLLHSNTFDKIQLLAHQLANVNQQIYLVNKKAHECPMGNFSQTLPSFLTFSPAGDYHRQGAFTSVWLQHVGYHSSCWIFKGNKRAHGFFEGKHPLKPHWLIYCLLPLIAKILIALFCQTKKLSLFFHILFIPQDSAAQIVPCSP